MTAFTFENTISVEKYFKEYVDVKRFENYCKECPLYGNKWSCPPFDFSPESIWERYDTLYMIGKKIYYKDFDEDQIDENRIQEMYYDAKHKLTDELYKLEDAHPGSMLFSAGCCDICGLDDCARRHGEPCRFPDKMRHSIEALGGDVVKSAKDLLEIDIQWAGDNKLPKYFTIVGGLLYNCPPGRKPLSLTSK